MPTYSRTFSCGAARLCTLAALLSTCFDVAAQSTNAASVDASLNPVIVTAARLPQNQTDALPHTTVITNEMIRTSQATDLPTLLRREAGLQFTQSGGPGAPVSLFMRGANPGESLLLIDGVPVKREGFSANAALENILPEQIDHIEIVRGNVSAIYGSGAIGGVIQIFTKRGNSAPKINASIEAGSRHSVKASADISGASDGTHYAVSATRFRTDGITVSNRTQRPNENPNTGANANSSVALALSHELTADHEIGLRAYANEGKFTYDGGGFGAPTDTNKSVSQQQSLALFSRDKFTQNWTSTVTASQTRTKNHLVSVSAFGYDIVDDSTNNLLQWANEIILSPVVTITAGADLGREKAVAQSDFGFGPTRLTPSRSTTSVYAGAIAKLDAQQLQLNVRNDHIQGSGSKTTGYLGYGYALSPSLKVIANASTAFNAPTLAQVFDPQFGNLALLPETSRSVELGLQYAASETLGRATIFKTRTKNQFGFDPNTFVTSNIAQASNQGLEVSVSTKLDGMALRASLTLQEPTDDSTHQILIRRARTAATLSADKTINGIQLGADLQYTGSRTDQTQILGAYLLTNVKARYAITPTVDVFGRIDNLFDRRYQTAYGYNQPPRGIFVGLDWHQ